MKGNNDLISIIIPVYNVEKYIEKCIESVIKQTYENIEIILVNDGSSDNCPEICEEYKKKDERIKVVHKKNGGLSDARNEGIKKSNGDYLYFLDSDDFIERDAIEYLLDLIKKNKADISSYAFWNYYNKDKCIKDEKTEEDYIEVMTNIEAIKKSLNTDSSFKWRATNKLFKRHLFDNVSFPYGKLYEDVGTTYKLLLKAERIVYSSIPKYFYVRNDDSITNTYKFNSREINRIEMCNQFYDDVLKEFDFDKELRRKLTVFRCSQYVSVINVMIRSNKYDKRIIKETKKILKENYFFMYNALKMKQKIQFLILIMNFRLYKIFFEICIR